MEPGRGTSKRLGFSVNRRDMLTRIASHPEPWDLIIIGGGATGAGIAVDASSRGYSVLLLEQSDFGKGTSSRSTKLVHGGVRYLEQGNIHLVREALHERGRLLRNAPHLVHDLPFILPTYQWWEAPFYSIGLKIYDWLAGRDQFGSSRYLNRRRVIQRIATIQTHGLHGGVEYHDGQFDDSRLLINLLQTAVEQGSTVLNYAQVINLIKTNGKVTGVAVQDAMDGNQWSASGKIIINATGAFCDTIRQMGNPSAQKMVAPSQGTHLVLDRTFLPGDTAIIVPHTSDGRVLFVIPWHGHVLVGTTDVGMVQALPEPVPTKSEVDFILDTAGRYLVRPPRRSDVLAVFAGIRPLVKSSGTANTASLSRDHTIQVEETGLMTITGGKWTTYRNMAEDCVNQASMLANMQSRKCVTKTLRIHGWTPRPDRGDSLGIYGSDAPAIRALQQSNPPLGEKLHSRLSYTGAEVVWAVREEMAITLEDVLARRIRALFLNARASLEMAPKVVEIMATEMDQTPKWQEEQLARFQVLAKQYLLD